MSISETKETKTGDSPSVPLGQSHPRRRRKRLYATAVILFGGIILLLAVWSWLARAGEDGAAEQVPTTTVKRGPLTVSVTEGGTLRAMESLEIKSEVEGNNQILYIVPEGTRITPQDVAEGKVLVELDSADLEERQASREISYRNAEASYVQAQENYAIQEQQNESNKSAALLKVKFAQMELARYVGAELAAQMTDEEFDFSRLTALASREVAQILEPQRAREVLQDLYHEDGDYPVTLGGTARQSLRDLSANVQLASAELSQALDDLEWTTKLVEKGYENENKLVTDRLNVERRKVNVDSAEEELRLFIRYTLPKEAEQRYSDLVEAERDKERVFARARSELAQAQANLESRKAQFALEKERYEKGLEMIEKSVIRATQPGLVVYASTSDPWRRQNNAIQEGANVRENETIISLPDLSTMAARVNIHETDVAKIKVGQPAIITVEALQGRTFPGHVARISPMASSQNRWLNPDLMVYETDVALDDPPTDGELSPGMSATAQIIVAELKDVLFVPVQAVSTYRGQRVCWVKGPDGPQRRPVETGYFTENYVEIRSGLSEGETVYLAPPPGLEEGPAEAGEEEPGETPESADTAEQAQAAPAAPDAETDAARPDASAQSGMQGFDWSQLRDLSAEERQKKVQEYLNSLPEKERKQLEQQMRRFMGGGGRGGQPGGGRPRQPAGTTE